MKPSALVFVMLAVAAACDAGPRIVVHASLDGRPVGDLPLTLLPYDRQRIQDSLRTAAGDDAPTPPQDLLRELAAADSALARPAADSAARVRADSLRRVRVRLAARLDTARGELAAWEEGLLRRADSLGGVEAEAADRGAAVDTTDDAGRAELAAAPGRSWIHARYVLPDAVMEWNVPVTLPAGQDSLVVRIDQTNGRRVRG